MDDDLNTRFIEKLRRAAMERGAEPPRPRRGKHLFGILWIAIVAVAVVLTVLAGMIEKWLWMRELHYVEVFWKLLSVQWGMFGIAFVLAFAFLWFNFRFAGKTIRALQRGNTIDRIAFVDAAPIPRKIDLDINSRILNLVTGVLAAFVSLLFALGVS
ncbi:MAG: UPF0182 family protein, partial [Acidobacteriaceae bacterium]